MEKQEFFSRYTAQLNDKQRRAVQTVNGPVLLLAVPGSGKTTVLVHRLGYMLNCMGIAPENILTITYTVAATKDMARRFSAVFGEALGDRLAFRTINGICYSIICQYGRMIGKPPFRLFTDEKQIAFVLSGILQELLPDFPTESDIKNARTLITYCKNMLFNNEEIRALGEKEDFPLSEVYQAYNAYLKENSLMDYDDQMVYAYRLLRGCPELLRLYQERYRYLLVDEAQDTSRVQHLIIGMLAGESGNLFMVGDEDQSIYGFRAAYPEALLNFEKEHPGAQVLVMDQNYRSDARIVAAADRLIRHNRARHAKAMQAVRPAGEDVRFIPMNSRKQQYAYLLKLAESCTRETAVLYRDNESALPLIDMLERQGIRYRARSVDMGFFSHRIVLDVLSILKLSLDPYDTEAFMRCYYKCQSWLKKAQAEKLCEISRKRRIPILDAAEELNSLSAMVRGKCRALRTNLLAMKTEAPGKAIFRIEAPMGYGEYLEKNHLDDNKLFILKQLAAAEESISAFLDRLTGLQQLIREKETDYDAPFILSTIHSAKGLEYDRVYLLDVCEGLFPAEVPSGDELSPEEREKLSEEERRLFYVGMTRAKNELNIFRITGKESGFIREITGEKSVSRKERTAVRKRPGSGSRTEVRTGDRLRNYDYEHVGDDYAQGSRTLRDGFRPVQRKLVYKKRKSGAS